MQGYRVYPQVTRMWEEKGRAAQMSQDLLSLIPLDLRPSRSYPINISKANDWANSFCIPSEVAAAHEFLASIRYIPFDEFLQLLWSAIEKARESGVFDSPWAALVSKPHEYATAKSFAWVFELARRIQPSIMGNFRGVIFHDDLLIAFQDAYSKDLHIVLFDDATYSGTQVCRSAPIFPRDS